MFKRRKDTERIEVVVDLIARVRHLELALELVKEDRNQLVRSIRKIENAIVEEGKMPNYHRRVMRRHRQEWGTLWQAIDEAIEEIHG